MKRILITKEQYLNKWLYFLVLFISCITFLVLSWKHPYVDKSLIGNFDPFPDTLHYVVPIRNFVNRKGFTFSRENGQTSINVPPLYSISLLPSYLINIDARSFYWSNIVLGLISIVFLYKIAKKLTRSPFLTALILLLYISNFVIYWQTSLAMAENVLLPVLLISIWLFLQPVNNLNITLNIIFAVFCYGSKYVSFPITFILIIFCIYKVLIAKINRRKKRIFFIILIMSFVSSFMLMDGKELLLKAFQILQTKFGNNPELEQNAAWLSVANVKNSFSQYLAALCGAPIYNLWYVKPILPIGLAPLVLLWCAYSFIKFPTYKSISLLIITLTVAQLMFLSLIVMIEGRYAFVFIPIMYVGLATFLGWLNLNIQKRVGNKKAGFCMLFLSID